MFIIETSLPFVARVALASTALGTSALSTALVGWCGHPYVATIRALTESSEVKHEKDAAAEATKIEGVQLETYTLTLQPRFTSVYDSAFLTETRRPFAKWELAESVMLQRSSEDGSKTPSEETVAETMDTQGKVLGRWIVSWNEERTKGECRREGKVQR
ncbi:hypothetical protein EW145_g2972 [Phellinidium pouzarii]|uniref:Uncharacterized protein n=1 Tax=Phellinidium pouzarii TaxID=167371 RepID=A0A4V3XD20_9AGAM|nr:hypothetical protein EW145_g2972 [Phellinidium pouzarii]